MNNNRNTTLMKYAGMATQFLVSIGISVYLGYKLDGWLHISFPVFVWTIPLLVIIVMLYKVIKETNSKK
jgi:hypothetical protein